MTTAPITLADDQLVQLADLIAARLQLPAEAHAGEARLVDAATVAAELGITRPTVYQHAERLGGRRIGDGPRARWRFDLEVARKAGACYRGEQSQAPASGAEARAGGGSEADAESVPARRRRRLPNGLPPAGSVLAVRPRAAHPADPDGQAREVMGCAGVMGSDEPEARDGD